MKKFSSFLTKITLLSFFFLTVTPTVLAISASDALAQSTPPAYSGSEISGSGDQNAFVRVMCNVLKIVTGNAGKALAAFAVITMGIGFFTGKLSWGLMIGLAMGIAAMFGAPTIVAALSGGTSYDCSNNGSL